MESPQRIAIIGNAGSGKSTLALKLHKLLGLPLYHLDQYFWKPGWIEPDLEEFAKIHKELCDRDSWIIEGMAIRFADYRLQRADIIIFLDVPTYLCLYRILKRAIFHFGREYFSSAKGCPERGPSLKFLKFIWNFNRERKPVVKELLKKYRNGKKIFVVKREEDFKMIFQNFSKISEKRDL